MLMDPWIGGLGELVRLVRPPWTGKSISISIRSCVRCEAVRGCERQVPPQRWGSGWEEFLLLLLLRSMVCCGSQTLVKHVGFMRF